MRPAWPMVRGRMRGQPGARLVGQALDRAVVDFVRQLEAFVATEGGDIGRLAGQIDVVFGVDFQLLRDVSRETYPNCGQMRARSEIPMLGKDRSSNAVRRWPSRLSARPCLDGLGRGQRNRLVANARTSAKRGHLCRMEAAPFRAHAADGNAPGGEPLVGVVRPQRQPVLRPRGEHPIGLGDPLGNEVVDHHPEVAFGAVEHDTRRSRRPATPRSGRPQALRRRFLIAGGPVDLAGEQARQTLRLPAWVSAGPGPRDRIRWRSRAAPRGPFPAPGWWPERGLDLLRQRGGDPVGIHRVVSEPLRLQENLVARVRRSARSCSSIEGQ